MRTPGDTVDPDEIDRFAAQADNWWDEAGSFRPLHEINRARLDFIRTELLAHFGCDPRSLQPFAGLSLVDIGCGGGLVAEPMARLGCRVTGLDADAAGIAAAQSHAEAGGLAIDYRAATAESAAAQGERFDIVLALELIEHVADPAALVAAAGALLEPGGLFIGATLNRTARAFALAVVGAEYVLRWLPRGTHDWRRFVRPSEFVGLLRCNGLTATRLAGVSYDPVRRLWSISQDVTVNYLVAARR